MWLLVRGLEGWLYFWNYFMIWRLDMFVCRKHDFSNVGGCRQSRDSHELWWMSLFRQVRSIPHVISHKYLWLNKKSSSSPTAPHVWLFLLLLDHVSAIFFFLLVEAGHPVHTFSRKTAVSSVLCVSGTRRGCTHSELQLCGISLLRSLCSLPPGSGWMLPIHVFT